MQKLHNCYTTLMEDSSLAIRTYFAKLGLDKEIADLYLALHRYGPQSISELSRNSGVERTRVYRLIDTLLENALIEVETQYKRGIMKAAPIANLHILITKKEQELKSLQDELSLVERVLASSSKLTSPATRVQFYQGAEGAKQMFWNETKAHTESLSILFENKQGKTKDRFFERWAKRCNERGLRFRSIFGDNFVQGMREWYAGHDNERLAHWEGRYIDPANFSISHSTVIYDNVVAYYNWHEGEIFGIEIYNQQIADTQRALFEMLWQKATPRSFADLLAKK